MRAEAGPTLESLADTLQGQLRPLWAGWEIRSQRARVQFRGGLFGYRTRIRVGSGGGHDRVENRGALLGADEVVAILRAWEIPEDGP